jgi:hypothetical protein
MLKYTICDIETSARPESELVFPTFEPSKVLKDPEKINADLAKKKAEFIETCALRAEHGKILVIGLLDHTGQDMILEGDEREVLQQFWASYVASHHLIVGHYIKGFDIPFIVRRSWMLGVIVPQGVMEGRYLNHRFFDTMEAWQLGTRDTISLDNLSKAFGLSGKNGNGKDFASLYQTDKAKAFEYLRNDLQLTRDVAKKMRLI